MKHTGWASIENALNNRRTIDEHGSKFARKSVFDCHLSPDGRQKVIENSVSYDFYLLSSIVLTFSIAAYPVRVRRLRTKFEPPVSLGRIKGKFCAY